MQEPVQEPERTSRQDLVVAPRQSSLPLLLGAVLCAGTGFGLVWALGIGRSPGGGEMATPAQAAMPMTSPGEPSVAFAPEEMAPPASEDGLSMTQPNGQPGPPGPFPAAASDADAPRAMNERGWRQPAAPIASPPTDDRYSTRPAALETPESTLPMPPPKDGRTSRFTPPGHFPGTGDEPIRLASAESAALDAQPAPDPTDPTPPADGTASADALPVNGETLATADAPLPGTPSAQPVGTSGDDLLAPAPTDIADPEDVASPLPVAAPPPEPIRQPSALGSDLPLPAPSPPLPPATAAPLRDLSLIHI